MAKDTSAFIPRGSTAPFSLPLDDYPPIPTCFGNNKVNRLKDQLRMELGRAPTKQELASEAGCTLEQLNACFEHGALSVSSLDHISGFGRVKAGENIRSIEGYITNEMSFFSPPLQSQTQLQLLPHQHSQPQSSRGLGGDARAGAKSLLGTGAEFMQVSLREDLKDALFRLLDATERQCLVLRYGLQDGVPKSVEETAEIMEFSDPDDVSVSSARRAVQCVSHRIVTPLCLRLVNRCRRRSRYGLGVFFSSFDVGRMLPS